MLHNILAAHFDHYPKMQPQDAVKLIYQNEFGPGHLIHDQQKALSFLRKEMDEQKADRKEALYETIGNGLCRLNLAACVQKGIPCEDIFALFLDAAQSIQGDQKEFRKKLRILSEMANRDETPFFAAELDLFLITYQEKRFPAVHHSNLYKALYAPAYRLVQQKKLKDYLAKRREAE